MHNVVSKMYNKVCKSDVMIVSPDRNVIRGPMMLQGFNGVNSFVPFDPISG